MLLFLGVFFAVVIAVAVWTITRTPIYSATSSLLVRPQADAVVNVEAVTPNLPATTEIVNTEVRLMQSPVLAWRVAARYATEHPNEEIVQTSTREQLANALSAMTFISRSASTYVIEVYAQSENPQQAADVANLFVTEFVASDRDSKINTNSAADRWLRERTAQLEQAATAADAALQGYRIQNGLISTDNTTLSEQEISSLNQQIAQAQADLAERQGRLASARLQLERGGGGADVGAALGSGTIGTLRSREAEASANVAQLQSRYGDSYPDLRNARSQLAAIRQDIQREIDRILSNLEAEVRVSESRLNSLEASRGRSTGVLSANNRAAVGLQELQRRADAAKAIYETFLNRSRETSAQQGLQRADTRVDSLAKVAETPDFPNIRLAIVLGLMGGLAAGFAAMGLAEYLQGGVRTKEDVERRLGLRYAGAIPTLGSTLGPVKATEPPQEYIISYPQSAFAESFRSLRAFMMLGGSGAQTARVIALTSPLPQEGKTTTAVCLARTSAMGGTSTVLVDCDLRRRGSSQLIDVDTNGLYDYLEGGNLDDALALDEKTGLYLLGTAKGPDQGYDPLTSEAMQRMIGELRKRFQLVIIDTAPLLGLADARVVAASADRVVMCTRWRKTSVNAANAAIELLINAGAKISGVALTQVDIKSYASTGYTDSYSYHKQFRGYYVN